MIERAGLGVEQPDHAVGAGGGQDLAVGSEGDRVDTPLGHLDAGDLLDPFLVILLQRGDFRGRSGGDDLLVDRLDGVRIAGVELVAVDADLAGAVEAAAGGDPLAVAADRDAIDPARQRGELADEVRIVADDADRLAEYAVELGLAVGAADDDFIPLGMAGDGGQPALEGPGRDRGDIVDEPLGGDLGQLGRHVAAERDEVRAFDREDGVERPVAVRAHEQDLLAGLGVDGPHGVVRAAEGDLGPVRRPARSIDRVISDGDGERELALVDIPDLDLAHPRGSPAGHGEPLAVGREGQRLDPLGEPDQAADQLRSIGLPQEDLMEAGDGQERPIGREGQGRDHREPGVLGGMAHVVSGPGGRRLVVGGALGDPSVDQLELRGGERRLVLRHLGLAVLGRDLVDEEALIGLARDDPRLAALASLEHLVEGRHDVAAAGLGRLMAALALGLEDRPDLLVEAHLRPGGGHRGACRVLDLGLGLRFLIGGAGRDRQHQQGSQGPEPATPARHDLRHLGLLPMLRSARSSAAPGPALEGRRPAPDFLVACRRARSRSLVLGGNYSVRGVHWGRGGWNLVQHDTRSSSSSGAGACPGRLRRQAPAAPGRSRL